MQDILSIIVARINTVVHHHLEIADADIEGLS
jgi:hypothetical protein